MDSLVMLGVGLGAVGVLICFVGSFWVLTYYAGKEADNTRSIKGSVERVKIRLEEDGMSPQMVAERKLTADKRKEGYGGRSA